MMFQRPSESYLIDFDRMSAERFMEDRSSPLANIVEMVPDGAAVLDVGAGNGLLGWLFHEIKPDVVIDGVEPSVDGGDIARRYYRDFYPCFLQEALDEIEGRQYDYVILADVIEHLVDPLQFLLELVRRLPDSTRLVLSIPNVAHYSVRLTLLSGAFRYQDSGLLEKTHLRFFVRETIEELVRNIGWSIERLYYLKRFAVPSGTTIRFFPGIVTMIRLLCDRDAMTYQYLLVLRSGQIEKTVVERSDLSIRRIVRFVHRRFHGKGGVAQ